jgi:aminopeptidase C
MGVTQQNQRKPYTPQQNTQTAQDLEYAQVSVLNRTEAAKPFNASLNLKSLGSEGLLE